MTGQFPTPYAVGDRVVFCPGYVQPAATEA